jgi:CRP-like cAMP-binding protein
MASAPGGPLPPGGLREALRRASRLRLPKGGRFLRAGEVPPSLGYVVRGLLRLHYIDPDGRDITKHFCEEGTLAVAYGAFIRQEPSPLFIEAIEESELLVVGKAEYDGLVSSGPGWKAFAKALSDRIVDIMVDREASFLSMRARERYLAFARERPGILERAPHYMIASYLGITPESLSRIRSSLR